jgi:Fe-S cluster assembly protein SufD
MAGLDWTVSEWERVGRLRERGGADELAGVRWDALNRFLSLGFPTTREEEWRFTSVAPIADRAFSAPTGAPDHRDESVAGAARLSGRSAAELVFVDGRYSAALSRTGPLPHGTRVDGLAAALAAGADDLMPYLARVASHDQQPFVALNTAFLDDGACIRLAAGTILEDPIHVLFVATGATAAQPMMTSPRVLVVLRAGSQASVVETYTGAPGSRYLSNAVTEIVLADNAVLDHYRIQDESTEAYHVGSVYLHASRSATCASHSISLGGVLARNEVVAVLDGEGVHCTLDGLYMADERRLVDNHTTIDHAKPHCDSREIYKGILSGRARGVFNGRIIVRQDAQKTDARQTNRALLLSEDAQINTKPQLEIFADDVKCTHGAAVGQLDAEALFYLRSRGLSDADASHLLIHAFAADVVNRLPLAAARSRVEQRLQQELARALAVAA